MNPYFHIVSGSPSSRKSQDMLRSIQTSSVHHSHVFVFSPLEDDILTHPDGTYLHTCYVPSDMPYLISQHVAYNVSDYSSPLLAIDKGHLYDKEIVDVLLQLYHVNCSILLSGDSLDLQCEPIPIMGSLMSYATSVEKHMDSRPLLSPYVTTYDIIYGEDETMHFS